MSLQQWKKPFAFKLCIEPFNFYVFFIMFYNWSIKLTRHSTDLQIFLIKNKHEKQKYQNPTVSVKWGILPALSNSTGLTFHNKLVLRMIKCVYHKQKLKNYFRHISNFFRKMLFDTLMAIVVRIYRQKKKQWWWNLKKIPKKLIFSGHFWIIWWPEINFFL